MMFDLPRYAETRAGEMPDGYFLDGARITPISRIVEAEEALPPAVRRLISAAVDQTIAAVSAVEAQVAAVENGIAHGQPDLASPLVPDALRVARENSASLAAWPHDRCVVIFEAESSWRAVLHAMPRLEGLRLSK